MNNSKFYYLIQSSVGGNPLLQFDLLQHTKAPFLVAAANGHWKVLKKLIDVLDKSNDAYDDKYVLQNSFAIRTHGTEENVLHLILNRPDSISTNSESSPKLEIQVRPVLTMLPGDTRSRSYKKNKNCICYSPVRHSDFSSWVF